MTSRVALEPSNCERAGERWPVATLDWRAAPHTGLDQRIVMRSEADFSMLLDPTSDEQSL